MDRNSGVKHKEMKQTVYKDKVHHVTMSSGHHCNTKSPDRVLVLEPCVRNEELVAHTEVQEPCPIFIALTKDI